MLYLEDYLESECYFGYFKGLRFYILGTWAGHNIFFAQTSI